jgi:hypothetical protein
MANENPLDGWVSSSGLSHGAKHDAWFKSAGTGFYHRTRVLENGELAVLDEKPRPMGIKGRGQSGVGAFALSALGESYHRNRTEPSSNLIFNGSCRSSSSGTRKLGFGKSTWLFAKWPDPDPRRKAQGRSKMFDGAVPQVLKTQQRFVGRFADFADCLQARGR